MAANGFLSNAAESSKPQGMAAYRAPSLLQPHRARQAIRDAHHGKIPPLTGFYCGLSSPAIAKVAAQMGYDMVWIDWEHSSCNVETMNQMVHDVQFVSEGKSIALVRVPGHDHAAIGYALDAGASIVVPQVDTVEQARHIVSAAKFGTKAGGTRSAPPARLMPGLSDMPLDPSKTIWENLNEQAAIIIQIESLKGINNLDAILTEVGDQIDAVWIGSLDARVSMGLPVSFYTQPTEPEWLEAMAKYEATLRKHDKPSSGFAIGSPEVVENMSRGKCLLFIATDVFAILGGMGDLAAAKQWPPQSFSAINKAAENSVV